ncbi:MAG TPA: proton-conducting transporter membrane subunit [Gemmatimonadales bacterium]|nr:proton-conducting transporter membrane subunit [Gemmatimonadales bacterium]
MPLLTLIILPALTAGLAYLVRSVRLRMGLLVGTAVVHAALVGRLWTVPAGGVSGEWLAADPLGLLVLSVVSILFLVIALYAVGFLGHEPLRGGRVFVSGLLGFLAAATLVALSQHLALLWVGMETTTLALAPLVYHRHDRRSLEAVWKYLLLSSVGIALALFGTFFLAAAQTWGRPLVLTDLIAGATSLHPSLLRTAFIFLLVGYGTKMGLAPLHAWKPDTYGEAPSLVAGLMAGGLTSCAFLGVARITSVTIAAGLGQFVRPLLLGFGIVSLVVAAAFMIGQVDLKRLLAYSSVEHMGLLVLGLGLGGIGPYGTVLHLVNNALVKGVVFLAVGNVVLVTGGATTDRARGILRRLPISGVLLLLGLFAVTGSPPFGLFLSEFTILNAAIAQGHPWIAVAVVTLLAIIFVGMASVVLEVVYAPAEEPVRPVREGVLLVGGPALLLAAVLVLGVYVPPALHRVLLAAAQSLGVVTP